MKKVALVTGASSGIGRELSILHAKNSGDLILVARNEQKLQELKSEIEAEYNVNVLVIDLDLTSTNAVNYLFDEVAKAGITVEYLINNAGYGDFGEFVASDIDKIENMLHLNITVLTKLTRLFLPQMIKNGFGRILNLSSMAAFLPGPLMSTYYASKHYVQAFSEGIARELKNSGVKVTALSPGPTESNFADKANTTGKGPFSGKIPTAQSVAKFGYKAMIKGKLIAIPGFSNKFLVFAIRFLPRKLVASIAYNIHSK